MKRLQRSALIAFGIHLAAGLAMGLILREGLETNPDLQNRLRFITEHTAVWTLGWLTWTAAAIAILYFYLVFASTHQIGNVAVLLTTAALAPDLSAQAIEIGVLPGIARDVIRINAGTDLFTAFHRTAVMMSGFVANGLYSISALILVWNTRAVYLRWVSLAGLATGCFGLLLSAATLVNSTSGMFWTNVFLVPCLLLWLAGVSRGPAKQHS